MNLVENLVQHARQQLPQEALARSGSVLYSAADTLRTGDVYILGVNPGADPEAIKTSVADSLSTLASNTVNAYLDEDWGYGVGKAALQQRLQKLTGSIGQDLRSICASNMVFMRSRSMKGINFWTDAETCWPVHQRILDIVQPRLVIAFGNSEDSPYAFLRKKLAPAGQEEAIASGHGEWLCRGFRAEMSNRNVFVAGFPHLSRYSPLGDDGAVRDSVRAWLLRAEQS